MSADPAAALLDTTHESLRDLIAGMMGAMTDRSAPAPHVSFMALGGTDAHAFELIQILNAVFGLELPSDTVLRSPTPDALARSIETAWFEGDGTVEQLIERPMALVDE